MQPIKTIWTISIGDHPGTIPVEFGRNPISSSREEVVWTFPYIIQYDARTKGNNSKKVEGYGSCAVHFS